MPDKIEWWQQIWRAIQPYLPFIGGFSIGAIIAYIRERREGTHWKHSLGEAITCGFLTVGLIRLMEWWLAYKGYSESWESLAEFCGAVIGFLGTKKVYHFLTLVAPTSVQLVIQLIKNRFGGSK